MSEAFIVAARRTPVVPRDGAFKTVEAPELAEAPIRAVLDDASLAPDRIDEVILGNALYGGGNPARIAALRAGLPEEVAAVTIDSQCCAGLDAVMLAASRIRAGDAQAVIAGGLDSFSRAPRRSRRPKALGETWEPYDQPPFTPWPERDPRMVPAAAALAARLQVSRPVQEAFAIESHRKALSASPGDEEIAPVAGIFRDAFARRLTPALCARLPLVAGDAAHGLTAATTALEADGAAALLVVSEDVAAGLGRRTRAVRILGGIRRGGDPEHPGLAPIAAATALLRRFGLAPGAVGVAEIMEAFAVQAIACIEGIGVPACRVNRGGGALARGHPIGASGAILAVRLWHELQTEEADRPGLAAVAAAGGLGSAVLLSR